MISVINLDIQAQLDNVAVVFFEYAGPPLFVRSFHNGLCPKSAGYVQAPEHQMTGHFHEPTQIFRPPDAPSNRPKTRFAVKRSW